MPQNLARQSPVWIHANPEEEDEERVELGSPYPWELPWAELLPLYPALTPLVKWDEITLDEWPLLLSRLPVVEGHCPWREMLGHGWSELLRNRPEFSIRCDWSLLIGSDWAELLAEQPQFAPLCRWESLRTPDWVGLLSRAPSFADRCPWESLRTEDWLRLLIDQPQFAELCQWEEVRRPGASCWEHREDWLRLLRRHLNFASQCPPEQLTREDWLALAPVKLFDFSGASVPDMDMQEHWNCRQWLAAVEAMPALLTTCPWRRFTSAALFVVLTEFPEYSHYCDVKRLQPRHCRRLLMLKPEYGSFCPWEKNPFTPGDWVQILEHAPQFAERCPWDWEENQVSPHEWLPLIRRRPEFAGKWPLLQRLLQQAQEPIQ